MQIRIDSWPILWLVLAAAAGGCTSLKTVPRGEQTPGKIYARSVVYLKGGEQYQFERLAFLPDSLVGEIKIEVEKQSPRVGIYYEKQMQAYRLPLAKVDSVAVIQRDTGKTLLYGAGAVALGVLIVDLVGNGKTQSSASSGGKSPGGGGP